MTEEQWRCFASALYLLGPCCAGNITTPLLSVRFNKTMSLFFFFFFNISILFLPQFVSLLQSFVHSPEKERGVRLQRSIWQGHFFSLYILAFRETRNRQTRLVPKGLQLCLLTGTATGSLRDVSPSLPPVSALFLARRLREKLEYILPSFLPFSS